MLSGLPSKLIFGFAFLFCLLVGIFLVGNNPDVVLDQEKAPPTEAMPSKRVARESRLPSEEKLRIDLTEAQEADGREISESDSLANSLRKLAEHPGVVPGELLLRFRYASDIASLRSRASSLGIQVLWSDARLNSARIVYSDPEALADELLSNQGIYEDLGPNHLMGIPGLPPKPEIDSDNPGGTEPFRDTFLESIGANGDRSEWGKGVTVAVLDSGIQDHPALENIDVVRIDLSTSDEIHGHGTAMASLVAGSVSPAEGIAPAVDLIDVRVTDENGISNTGLVAEAILSAADRGADVINISLGAVGHSPVLEASIKYAHDRGVVVVAAAGNEQTTQLAYPAAYNGVISVGAVDAANTQAYFSNSGETLTISAPGVGIVSAYSDEQLILGSGTSQATAITSGVVAALLGRGHKASEMARILESNAFRTGAPREQVGAGVIRVP